MKTTFDLKWTLWLVCALKCVLVQGKSWSREMTVLVGAQARDCFFIPDVPVGHQIVVDFQVVNSPGATGNLDIDVQIMDAQKNEEYDVEREEEGNHEFTTRSQGDIEICLDNSYSVFADKTVYLEMDITDVSDDYYDDYMDEEFMKEMREMDRRENHFTIEDVQEGLHGIRSYIRDISHFQARLIASHSQDLHMAEKNRDTISMWSMIHVCFLIVIGFVQVVMVKSLFEDKAFIHRLFARSR